MAARSRCCCQRACACANTASEANRGRFQVAAAQKTGFVGGLQTFGRGVFTRLAVVSLAGPTINLGQPQVTLGDIRVDVGQPTVSLQGARVHLSEPEIRFR